MHRSASARILPALVITASVISPPGAALAFHPNADCGGAWSAAQLARGSFVQSTATLERLQNGSFEYYGDTHYAHSGAQGDVLISAPWSATPAAGTYRVRLDTVVFDGLDDSSPTSQALSIWPAGQRFNVSTIGEPFNCGSTPPAITSTPVTAAVSGASYTYQPQISQSGGADPRFALLVSPPGMIINQTTGAIAWSPSTGELQHRTVILMVEDAETGLFDIQAYEISVTTN